MDLRHDLKEQYHAALAMLANCIEQCPDDLWVAASHPRTFWRIALHAAFFTQFYLGQDVAAYQPWADGPADYKILWVQSEEVEPYELPDAIAPLSRQETLAYIAYINGLIGPTIDRLDLDTTETGFPWYHGMSKLSHELMNLRHIQGHVGQLSELLMLRGIDTRWIGKSASIHS